MQWCFDHSHGYSNQMIKIKCNLHVLALYNRICQMEEGLGMHMPEAPSKMELFFFKRKIKSGAYHHLALVWLSVW